MYLDLDSIRSLEKDPDRTGISVIDKRGYRTVKSTVIVTF
jgi:hypothetical protein